MQAIKQFVGILVLLGVVVAVGYVGLWFHERHEHHTTRGHVDQKFDQTVKGLTRLDQEKSRRSSDATR
jgi:hypothetical protein